MRAHAEALILGAKTLQSPHLAAGIPKKLPDTLPPPEFYDKPTK